MSRFISAHQYKKLTQIPSGRLAVRTKIYCGAIIEKKGKVLLVKSKEDKYAGWDFPGGKLLWNEDVLSCTEREVLEESRYKPKLDLMMRIIFDLFLSVLLSTATKEKSATRTLPGLSGSILRE